MDYFPNNAAGQYFTKLPQPIQLEGKYEVGLSEIQFSNTYKNVYEDQCIMTLVVFEDTLLVNVNQPSGRGAYEVKEEYEMKVPAGLYESADQFISTLNTILKQKLGYQENGKSRVKLFYNNATKKCRLSVYEENCVLELSDSLKRILRIGENQQLPFHRGRYEGEGMVNLNEDFKSVFVYCDIVSPRPVGDVMAPLLRIVPMEDKMNEVVHRIYEKPHYCPLSRQQMNMIEIFLSTHLGQKLSFDSGNTIITLHFRPIRPELF